MSGKVYILANPQANRVKVGMTVNKVEDRLEAVNGMWHIRRGTCQVCGAHRYTVKRKIAKHVQSGIQCLGGNELPFEVDTAVARKHRDTLKQKYDLATGTVRGSIKKQINNLDKKIQLFTDYCPPKGTFQISAIFHTNACESVEKEAHKQLDDYLDRASNFGEVFSCSVEKAVEAVEQATIKLKVSDKVKKESFSSETSKDYGECVICGGYVNQFGNCPSCIKHFLS